MSPPTIARAIASVEVSFVAARSTMRPARMTVTRVVWEMTSPSLCVMTSTGRAARRKRPYGAEERVDFDRRGVRPSARRERERAARARARAEFPRVARCRRAASRRRHRDRPRDRSAPRVLRSARARRSRRCAVRAAARCRARRSPRRAAGPRVRSVDAPGRPSPAALTVPLVGASLPAAICASVDLPAPFSPQSACISPGASERSASSTARTPSGYVLKTAVKRSAAPGASSTLYFDGLEGG